MYCYHYHRYTHVQLLFNEGTSFLYSKYAGDPIDCMVKHSIQGGDEETFDRYCWVEGTFTKKLTMEREGKVTSLQKMVINISFFCSDPFLKLDYN